MNWKHKLKRLYLNSALLALIIMTLVVSFWKFYPYQTISHQPQPYKLDKIVVEKGSYISYDYEYCKYTDVHATVTKQFVDGLVFQSDDIQTHLDKGCGKVHKQTDIPETLPSGEYILRITSSFHVNPIRDIVVTTETEKFTVK